MKPSGALRCGFALLVLLSQFACDKKEPSLELIDPPSRTVLYSSVDEPILRPILAEFTERTGIVVELRGDTEQTKTFGLVGLVVSERDAPKADVWWSSEPFGTIALARAGVFSPHKPAVDPWPSGLAGADDLWHGFAVRARVLVINTKRVSDAEVPETLRELTGGVWKGRVGMAHPAFGTTRGHMAALAARWGDAEYEAWLAAMHDNGLRIYDGNATVVRAVANGEIDVGLTDTDDVWAGLVNGWPVKAVYEVEEGATGVRWWSEGPMAVPNTAALIKGGPNPHGAQVLLDWILSPACEEMLARSDSHNMPVLSAMPDDLGAFAFDPSVPDLVETESRMESAVSVALRVLGLDE